MQTIPSICAYCGCGCRLLFQVDNGKIVKVVPDRTDDVSEGIACIKGLTIHESVGDNHDTKYKQAITAAGAGCKAALDTQRYLQ